MEYLIDSSHFFQFSLSASPIFLLLSLLYWTSNFLISSLLSYHFLCSVCFLQFYLSSLLFSIFLFLLSWVYFQVLIFILWKFLFIAYCSYLMETIYFLIPWRILIMLYLVCFLVFLPEKFVPTVAFFFWLFSFYLPCWMLSLDAQWTCCLYIISLRWFDSRRS